MTHPTAKELALFAGGECGFTDRWRVGRHVNACVGCRSEVDGFRAASSELRAVSGELPEHLNWDRLASEMTANIHLGLEAGECVTPIQRPAPKVTWRAAAVMASMSVVLGLAWFLNPPPTKQVSIGPAPRVEIGTTDGGIELKENGASLALMHGRGGPEQKPIIVSAPGTLRARYVDTDTGQITINNVYAE